MLPLAKGQQLIYLKFQVTDQEIIAADFNSVEAFINGELVDSKVVDRLSYSEPVGGLVNVYPNPTASDINVEVAEDATLEITSISGAALAEPITLFANEKHVIVLGDLSNGVYLMKIYNNNFSIVKKVVIKK
jgi:hypothetical protein